MCIDVYMYNIYFVIYMPKMLCTYMAGACVYASFVGSSMLSLENVFKGEGGGCMRT